MIFRYSLLPVLLLANPRVKCLELGPIRIELEQALVPESQLMHHLLGLHLLVHILLRLFSLTLLQWFLITNQFHYNNNQLFIRQVGAGVPAVDVNTVPMGYLSRCIGVLFLICKSSL